MVDSNCRLPQLNAVVIPDHVDDGIVRSKLLNDFNLEIGAGLGDLAGRVWRIGLMGQASNTKNIEYCLSALKSVPLSHQSEDNNAIRACTVASTPATMEGFGSILKIGL